MGSVPVRPAGSHPRPRRIPGRPDGDRSRGRRNRGGLPSRGAPAESSRMRNDASNRTYSSEPPERRCSGVIAIPRPRENVTHQVLRRVHQHRRRCEPMCGWLTGSPVYRPASPGASSPGSWSRSDLFNAITTAARGLMARNRCTCRSTASMVDGRETSPTTTAPRAPLR